MMSIFPLRSTTVLRYSSFLYSLFSGRRGINKLPVSTSALRLNAHVDNTYL